MPPSSAPDELEADALLLRLTLWQRALVGPDRFLGRADVPLAALLEGGRSHQDQWYKLHSKPGKKEKERGEIQLSIQFTRHSLTASMFDLSVKDKPRSPFGRLRDKVKGRRRHDLESASAVVPSSSSSGGLDDPGGGDKKAKARVGGFLRGRLRRSSLTQSSASLGSDSTASSAGSTVGVGAAEWVSPSPTRHGSLSTDRPVRDFLSSPRLTHKRAFSDEASQVSALPESRSSLCINGSHVYCEEPAPKPASLPAAAPPPQSTPSKPGASLAGTTGPPAPELPPWSSSSGFQKGPPKDPPRFIPSPPILAAQEEDKLSVKTIALNKHRGRGRREEGPHADSRPVQIAMPMVFSPDVVRVRPREEERAKAGVFRRWSSKDDGGGRRLAGDCPEGPSKAGGEEPEGSSPRGLQDARESLPQPSVPPELATQEVARSACLAADRGPAAFVGLGELQAEAAATKPPLDWDDSFDAFASSRLRPEACRGRPQPPADGAGPCQGEGEEAPPASGGLPGAPEEDWRTGRAAGSWRHQRGQGAHEAGAWRGGGAASSAGPTVPSDSGLPPGPAAEEAACGVESSPTASEEQRREGNPADDNPLADLPGWGLGRHGQTASLMSPHGGRLAEVAGGAPLEPCCSPEGGEGPAAMPEGAGEARAAEAPPPKPRRRLTPLSLEEEAGRAVGGAQVAGWQEGAVLWEPQEDPAGEAGQRPAGLTGSVCGGAVGSATEALGSPADAEGPVPTTEQPPGRAASPEEASVAEPFAAGPSTLSRGQEQASWPPWAAALGPPAECLGQASVQTAQELLGPGEARPSGALQESEACPATLPWAAWRGEQQQLGEPRFLPRQEPGDGSGLSSSWGPQAGGSSVQAPPPARAQSPGGSWVGEPVVDFKKADFWQAARGEQSSRPRDPVELPGNPFASPAKNNPFVGERPDALPAPASAGLDSGAAPPSPSPASPSEAQPLAASTPSPAAAPRRPAGFDLPSPIVQLASSGGSAQPTLALPRLSGVASAPSALPPEAQSAEEGRLQPRTSLHLVKPISTPVPESSGQEEEQLQPPSLTPGQRPAPSGQQEPRPSTVDSAAPKRDPSAPDPSAKYYHLTHEELIQLLLKREAELGRRQEQVRELENYIDRLLVRIMEQTPTLLQIPLGGEPRSAK